MYFILPETEQRSLEDIESHYSDNKKGITDIYISKDTKTTKINDDILKQWENCFELLNKIILY